MDRDRRNKFNEVAREYDEVRPAYPAECIDRVIEYAALNNDSRILEVGCGTGKATGCFIERDFFVTGIDIGEAMVEVARSRFGGSAEFLLTSFEDFEDAASGYDLIYSATAFHWVDQKVRWTKAAKLLDTGGTLALFWNYDTRRKSSLRDEIDQAYKDIAPSEPTDGERQTEFKVATDLMEHEVLESSLFESVQIERRPWEFMMSKESYCRLLNTFSYHRSLPPIQKDRLISQIGKAVERAGGSITIYFENVLVLAKAA